MLDVSIMPTLNYSRCWNTEMTKLQQLFPTISRPPSPSLPKRSLREKLEWAVDMDDVPRLQHLHKRRRVLAQFVSDAGLVHRACMEAKPGVLGYFAREMQCNSGLLPENAVLKLMKLECHSDDPRVMLSLACLAQDYGYVLSDYEKRHLEFRYQQFNIGTLAVLLHCFGPDAITIPIRFDIRQVVNDGAACNDCGMLRYLHTHYWQYLKTPGVLDDEWRSITVLKRVQFMREDTLQCLKDLYGVTAENMMPTLWSA